MNKLPLAVAVLGLAGLAGCQRGLPVEEAERQMLLRAADLVEYGYGLEDVAPFEKFDKTRYFDGSSEITYEFNTPESESDHPLYVNVTLTFERKTSDAMVSHGTEKTALKYGLKIGGIEAREVEKFHEFGDSSTFYILEKDGKPVGNLFSARQGAKVYSLVMSGMYFDDADTWKELMDGRLAKFSAYKPP